MLTGDRIKELRLRLGLSQSELGDRVDTDSTTISRWETNRVRVSQKYLVKLANALCTSTDYLLGDTDDPVALENALTVNPPSNEKLMNAPMGKRLIIKNNDVYVNLPETSEGFEMLRRFFDMQAAKNGAVMNQALAHA